MIGESLSFVCWKWKTPPGGGARFFASEHVNTLRAMLARHYARPHRLLCVTDDPHGLDPRVEAIPLPLTGFEHLVNPHEIPYLTEKQRATSGAHGARRSFPSCYRRLWAFSEEARAALGPRVFSLDIDVIVMGDLIPLVEKAGDATFCGWYDERFSWNKIAGGAFLMTTGAHTNVWTDFNPDTSPQEALRAGNKGSDQAWMSYKLWPPKAHWSSDDGVVKVSWIRRPTSSALNKVRLAFTAGYAPPWSLRMQQKYPWITRYYKGDE